MARHIVLFKASPARFFYGRVRSCADYIIRLADARIYAGPACPDDETAHRWAFRLASNGPSCGESSAPVLAARVPVDQSDIIIDVTPVARAAWEATATFDVILTGYGPNKIATIRAVRELTGFDLKEAKDVVEAAALENPQMIRRGLLPETATDALKMLRDIGADARLEPSKVTG